MRRKEDFRSNLETSTPPPLEKPAVSYEYLSFTDLIKSHIDATRFAYENAAKEFALLEWKSNSIKKLINDVFTPVSDLVEIYTEEFNQNSRVKHEIVFFGCGNVAEAAILGLIAGSAEINAIDISPNMLQEGLKKLSMRKLLSVSRILKQTKVKSWIESIENLLLEKEALINFSLKEGSKKTVINNFRKRIRPILADMTDLSTAQDLKTKQPIDLTAQQYDLAMAIASVPHIAKTELLPFIHTTVNMLKPGGTFFFNVRLDEEQTQSQGRVFMDTVLKGLPRYFTTYTLKEIADYMYQLTGNQFENLEFDESVPLENQIGPNQDGRWQLGLRTQDGIILDVEFTGISTHQDVHKPRFLGIKIGRRATHETTQAQQIKKYSTNQPAKAA